MTNKQLQALKPFIKFKNIIDLIPGQLSNWPEKLSGKSVRGIKREFTKGELENIQEALLIISSRIIKSSSR